MFGGPNISGQHKKTLMNRERIDRMIKENEFVNNENMYI